jgi:outer membrane receptor protein involved in Fe transport
MFGSTTRRDKQMRPRNVVLLAVLFALASLPVVGSAQETTATISGRVTDPQGLAVPGVTITVIGPQGNKTAVTDTDGRFQIPYLVPGPYTVRAELQGFKKVEQPNVVLRLGQTIDVPLTMQVGGVTETVDVQGSSPVVDTSSTTIGASLDSQLLERVPIGRRFSDTLYIAPGVTSGGSVGNANPSVSGASGLDNQYVIDGVNVSNGGYGALGSYSIVFGSLGNGTPYDFMQEVQVKTGGYEAEFGQATGGVINVITKSGTNKLTGTLFGYARPSQLESDYTQIQSPNGTVNTVSTRVSDFGAAIGGPILRDRLFFFGAIDPSWDRRTLIAPDNTDTDGSLQFPLHALGNVNRDRRVLSYAAKGTWQMTPNHRFDASFFGDPAKGLMGPQRGSALLATDTSSFSEINKYGGHNQTVRYSGTVSSRWLLEASFARALNEVQETPSVNTWRVTDTRVTPQIITGGIGFYEAGNRSDDFQYRATSTNLLGGHELKYGAQYETLTYDQVNQRTGPTFTTPVGDQTATGATIQILPDPNFGQIYRVTRANLNSARTTKQKYVAAFVEDTWKVGNRLTLKPGVRYEQETLDGTLIQGFKLDNNFAPRIGATFDLTGSSRSKLYGSYGIFYQRIPNDLAARALSADAGIGADYFDANLTQAIPNGVLAGPPGRQTATHYSIAGVGADVIDPNAKVTYMQEYLVGVEHQVAANTSVGVRYVHRNIPRVLEDIQAFPVAAADLGLPGADSVDYTLTNPSPSTPTAGGLGASFEKPIHDYDSVEFTFDRRFSGNWALQASYRWSRLWGNYEGSYRDDNGQSDPGITSLFDFPTNDPSYTAIGVPQFGYQGDIRFLGRAGAGPLPLDRPHQVKIYGSTVIPFGINVGVGLNFSSGYPLTALAANPNPNYQNGGEIPLTPRGAGFQTVDGFKTRSPFESNVNAHVDYGLRLGGPRRIVLMADIFNLFDQQRTVGYDNYVETSFGAPNPNFGQRVSAVLGGAPPFIQTPREIRIGARFEF